MSRFDKSLALPKTISDMINDRNDIIRYLTDADRSLTKARNLCSQVGGYIFPVENFRSYTDIDKLTVSVDRRMWRRTIELTGFNKFMDAQARVEFDKSLEVNPPEFNEGNVRATLISSASQAGEMMNRGVVNLFKSLCGKYKTNDGFKVNKKIILSRWFTVFMGDISVNYHQEPEMNDLDRVVRTIDHVDFKEHSFSSELRRSASYGSFENEYFKIKMFKNGNAHLWFKRVDILDSINDIIADYYGSNAVSSR